MKRGEEVVLQNRNMVWFKVFGELEILQKNKECQK